MSPICRSPVNGRLDLHDIPTVCEARAITERAVDPGEVISDAGERPRVRDAHPTLAAHNFPCGACRLVPGRVFKRVNYLVDTCQLKNLHRRMIGGFRHKGLD
jgi:hypothetical protein